MKELFAWLLIVSVVPPAEPSPPQSSGRVVTVRTSAEFATAAAQATPGTTIALDSSGIFAGLVLPDNTDGITIRPTGERAVVSSVGATKQALLVGLGCDDLTIEKVSFQSTNNVTTATLHGLVLLGYSSTGSGEATSVDQLSNRVEIRNCEFLGVATGNTRFGLLGNARNLIVRDCVFSEIHETTADSQAIIITNSPGPFLIERCNAEAAGENILFGGSKPRIQGVQAADITVRYNKLNKPPAWKTAQPAWQVKNLLELKTGVRAHIHNNTLTNNWLHAQNGTAVLFTPRDLAQISDVLFENNVVLNVGGGVLVSAADNIDVVDKVTGPIEFHNNLWINVGGEEGTGRVYNFASPDGRMIESVTIDGDRWFHSPGRNGSVALFEGKAKAVKRLFVRNTTGTHSAFGWIGGGTAIGTPSLDVWVESHQFENSVLIDLPQNYPYPDGIFKVQTR